MKIVILALGTNLGNRVQNLHVAIQELEQNGIKIITQSRVYETTPMYVVDQPRFLNMALKAETNLDSDSILKTVKHLEQKIGRVESFRNGPRLIDLDILYLDKDIINQDNLYIPHISIIERQFVLQPLLDIDKDWIDPRHNKTILEMANALETDPTISVIADSLDAIHST